MLVTTDPINHKRRINTTFRCQVGWLLEDGFADIVRQAWNTTSWSEAVNSFTEKATTWNCSSVGNYNRKKAGLLRRIEGIQSARSRGDNQQLAKMERDLWKDYNKALTQEELLWFQKSRCEWLKWGDRNTKFFHTVAVVKGARNRIDSLKDSSGQWVFDQDVL